MKLIFLFILSFASAFAEIVMYGPGGMHVPLEKAANLFSSETGIKTRVVWGPESAWTQDARKDANFMYGGAEQYMQGVAHNFSSKFDYKESIPLYYRDAVIFVQKGNPKKITGLRSLLKPEMRIFVIGGMGTSNTSGTGLWEDVLGRMKSVEALRAFQKNIIENGTNTGLAAKAFKDPTMKVDAFISFAERQKQFAEFADVIEIEKEYRIARSIAIMPKKEMTSDDSAFLNFLLKDKRVDDIFKEYNFYK